MTDFFFCCFSPFTGINCNLFYIKAQAKKKKGRGPRRDLNSNSREFAHHHCFIRERIVSGSACGKNRRRVCVCGSVRASGKSTSFPNNIEWFK